MLQVRADVSDGYGESNHYVLVLHTYDNAKRLIAGMVRSHEFQVLFHATLRFCMCYSFPMDEELHRICSQVLVT